jgi:hypothetical protein
MEDLGDSAHDQRERGLAPAIPVALPQRTPPRAARPRGATFVNGKLVERPHNQINEVSYSVPETSRQPSPLRVFMLVVSGRPALTATILISKQAA